MNETPQKRVRLTTPVAVTIHAVAWLLCLLVIASPTLDLVKGWFQDHGFATTPFTDLVFQAARAIDGVVGACFVGIVLGLIVDAVVYRAFVRDGHDGVRLGWFWAILLIPVFVMSAGIFLIVGIPF